jgi:tetratricopeptide (TPR) repeat protein
VLFRSLAQEQPDEALAAFEEAAAFKPDDPAAAGAATVGQAEALAGLGRHEDSRAALRAAAQMLPTSPGERDRALKRVRATVRELWEARLEAADYANAQDYLSLAAELTPPDLPAEKLEILEKLGGTALLASNAAVGRQRAEHLSWAGAAFEAAAALATAEPERQGGLLWSAAQSFEQAGDSAGVRRNLLQFLASRPPDERWPLAYLELGQAFECAGNAEEALRWYARLREQYPALEEAFRGALRSAGCLIEAEREAEAEALLLRLLDNDVITPRRKLFVRPAATCELLYQQTLR